MIKAVVGVLYSSDLSKVLLLKRRDKDRETAGWCFPGGKRDGVEDIKETLIREFLEETGLIVCPTKLILCADSGKYRIYAYEVFVDYRRWVLALSDEHEEADWVTPDQALQPDCFPLAGPVTERILRIVAQKEKERVT